MNKENKLQDQHPVILCHAACSGGSMIYRLIVGNFDLMGISEISHCYPFEKNRFLPTDPEHALRESGEINNTEFEDIFFDRIQRSTEVSQIRNKLLLIREHTHSYFFTDSAETKPLSKPSWIVDQYQQRLGKQIKCIVSVRDPIDSWLSLMANFPGNTPITFQAYCARYEKFIQTLDSDLEQQHILLVRYEDMVGNQKTELQRIAKFLGVSFSGEAIGNWSQIPSSGNSGRQDNKIQKRPRRPFGTQLIRDVNQSESYNYLVKRLDYSHLGESVTVAVKIRSRYIDIRKGFASVLSKILGPVYSWTLRRLRVP